MIIEKKSEGIISIILNLDELLIIHQSLNEVIGGFRCEPFTEKIGDEKLSKEELKRLGELFEKNRINGLDQKIQIETNIKKVLIYKNAVKETIKEIKDWEFSTRVAGLPKSFARDILNDLEKSCTS